MHHRDPEGVDGLPREVAAREVGDRDRGHHRKARAAFVERAHDARERRLGVEGVEGGLDQQQVHAAVDQAQGLLVVGRFELGIAHGPSAGVVDVARERGRLVRRPERTGDPARPVRLRGRGRVDSLARGAGGGDVDVVDERLGAVVGLRDAVGVERVGLDDVRARGQVFAVGGLHEIRPAQVQELVVALDVLRPALEPLAPVVLLGQPMGLQQRAHRPVDDEHTPLELSHERFVPRTPVSTHNTSV